MENEVRRTQTLTVEDTTGTHQNTIQDATRDRAAVLRLRARARDTPRVTWSSETVDNENLGLCCIFHPKDEDSGCNNSCDSRDVEGWNTYEAQPKYGKPPPT